MSKWTAILKTGKFTDSAGQEHSFSEKDLDAIVSKYDPTAGHEAPEVIGHPKVNAPAWGWVKGLKREGQFLFYEPKGRVQEFQDMINKGMFKKRSVSLYPDMTLRHVGWLGAQPPAVKGLPDPATFADGEGITIEFSEASAINSIGYIFGRLRDWLIGEKGQDVADQIVSPYEIDDLKNVVSDEAVPEEGLRTFADASPEKTAQTARSKKYGISIKSDGHVTKPAEYAGVPDDEFMDPVNFKYPIDAANMKGAMGYWGMPKNREGYTPEEQKLMTQRMLVAAKRHGIAADPSKWNFSSPTRHSREGGNPEEETYQQKEEDMAENEELKRQLAEEKAKTRKLELANMRYEFSSFCESLNVDGKIRITTVLKPAVMDFMEILSGVETYEFAEVDDDGKETKKSAQPLERFKTLLKGLPVQVEFSEKATKARTGDAGDKDREALISDFMEKNKGTSYKNAVLAISKDHPELFEER